DINIRPGILQATEKSSLRSVTGKLPPVRSGLSREFSHSEIVSTDTGVRKKRKYVNLKDSFEEWSERVRIYTDQIQQTFAKLDYTLYFEPSLPETTGREYFEASNSLSREH